MNQNNIIKKIKFYIENQEFDKAEKILINGKFQLPEKQKLDLYGILYDQKAISISDKNLRNDLQKNAIKFLSKSLSINRKDPLTFSYIGNVYHHICGFGDPKACKLALKYYKKAEKLGLDPYLSNKNLGNSYRRNEKPNLAEKYYLRALKASDDINDKFGIFFNLTYLYTELKDIKKAKYIYKEFIKLSKNKSLKKTKINDLLKKCLQKLMYQTIS